MAYRKSGKKMSMRIVGGMKVNWTGKTKSGKGRVTLGTKGTLRIKRSVTPYRTADGKRRMLNVEMKTWVTK